RGSGQSADDAGTRAGSGALDQRRQADARRRRRGIQSGQSEGRLCARRPQRRPLPVVRRLPPALSEKLRSRTRAALTVTLEVLSSEFSVLNSQNSSGPCPALSGSVCARVELLQLAIEPL